MLTFVTAGVILVGLAFLGYIIGRWSAAGRYEEEANSLGEENRNLEDENWRLRQRLADEYVYWENGVKRHNRQGALYEDTQALETLDEGTLWIHLGQTATAVNTASTTTEGASGHAKPLVFTRVIT